MGARKEMPKRILRPKAEGVTIGWRKWQNDDLHDLQSSLKIMTTFLERKNAERISEKVNIHVLFWWGILKDRVHLDDGRVGKKMTLKCILTKYNSLYWLPLAQYEVHRCVTVNKVTNTHRNSLTK
jgi:hypothetical protein